MQVLNLWGTLRRTLSRWTIVPGHSCYAQQPSFFGNGEFPPKLNGEPPPDIAAW